MKKILNMTVVFLFLVSVTQAGTIGDESKIELGKQLFNDPAFAMSKNKKSCDSCHPDGKGIGEAENNDYTNMINRCIAGALKGQVIEDDSKEMQAIQAYLNSLVQ
jgi:cytochrome c peroxidase